MDEDGDDKLVKLVVVGDGAVGKTCMLLRLRSNNFNYTKDEFPHEYVPTIFESYVSTVNVDGEILKLGLWDTAGQEEYERLRPLSYSKANIFLVVLSIDKQSSLKNAIEKWFKELQGYDPNIPILFVGNKIDLRNGEDDYKLVSKEQAQQAVENLFDFEYMECSALTQEGLTEVFEKAIRLGWEHKKGEQLEVESNTSRIYFLPKKTVQKDQGQSFLPLIFGATVIILRQLICKRLS